MIFSRFGTTKSRTLLGAGAALTVAAGVAATALAAAPLAGAAQPQGATTRYVALGDSFTAGPGIPAQSGGACARSDHNYPSLLARATHPAEFVDVSCSGAVTAHMESPQGSAAPQFDALTPETTLVTVGIGGNDVGFGSIIGTCVTLAASDPTGRPCTDHYTAGGVDRLEQTFAEKAPRIAAVLQGIHHRSPNAEVVLVGYQAILPATKAACDPANPNRNIVAENDFPYLAAKERSFAQILAATASANNATFVDTRTASEGHETCTAPGTRWIEGVVDVVDAAPVHPNALGMENVAHLVQAEITE
ncbi:SGNH/GDSL hydrolase family protein [Actinokineospora sp. PR83]|uniref:SGNH/GDSL hydrolase family protein n=1 Tax=Actinokineospora sp. PR83 TaxID=2884908 RepID=UPI0027E14410|nr:SGNH/GDSL hydrolase family protein [Actinokineospora sp. PR83]MCG8918227.1 SGNH/GDSL hydrolase family protein [Actinokineospora sp. PR83]